MAAVAARSFWSAPDPDDPLSKALQPPIDETPEERAARLRELEDAARVSREIDDEIAVSRRAYDRRKKAIKILLLGQAESGKSTTLKNFQLAFSPQHFHKERAAWKTIIQLNLIRNIKRLLEILQEEWESSLQTTTPSSIAKGKGVAGRTPSSPGVRFSTSPLNDNHRRIRMRLSALLPIEAELMRKLMPDGGAADRDVCVRAGSGWKGILTAINANTSTVLPEKPPLVLVSAMKGAQSRPSTGDARFKDNPTAVLAACRDDIVTLWEDAIVQGVLKKQNARIQDMPGLWVSSARCLSVLVCEQARESRREDARLRRLASATETETAKTSLSTAVKNVFGDWDIVRRAAGTVRKPAVVAGGLRPPRWSGADMKPARASVMWRGEDASTQSARQASQLPRERWNQRSEDLRASSKTSAQSGRRRTRPPGGQRQRWGRSPGEGADP
ncbi:G-protein alpha subunit-domain-containing protein [Cerioporus squamosus]|nr:G-protein alpha subunit-domain-containing protein [Cerioporus squamosus]